ncbi:MAG: hypothetical protein MJY94_01250 [Bacteroidales bacterium]|nr:hypothetical protein [Bacteroidales bacterium]
MASIVTYPLYLAIVNVIVLGLLCCVIYKLFIPKLLEELAKTLVARTQSYQEEKGRNQATKEDISEITKMIEDVKASIETTKEIQHE